VTRSVTTDDMMTIMRRRRGDVEDMSNDYKCILLD
jgi:hypothetical protein